MSYTGSEGHGCIPRLYRRTPQDAGLARNCVRIHCLLDRLARADVAHSDTTLYPQNFWEEIKQWTNIFNVSQTPVSNITNDPLPGYSRASYGPNVQAILAQGVGHTVPEQAGDVLNWFGITGGSSTTTPPITGPTGPTTTSTPPTSTPVTGPTAPHWGQCGGIGWTGPTGNISRSCIDTRPCADA